MGRFIVYRVIVLFFLAGLCEIGGGYLLWQAIRGERPVWLGVAGGVLLILYGLIATLQPADFSRTYAAYGGIFIVMSVWWGWYVDGLRPDMYDLIGGTLAFAGAMVIFFAPHHTHLNKIN
jgi:small multidrug resistance family-3 protein